MGLDMLEPPTDQTLHPALNPKLDPRDQALQQSMPCVAVPRFGTLPALPTAGGMRLLVARSGLYVQVQLDWLDAVVRVQSLPARPPLPYGDVAESIRFAFGVIPIALLEAFINAGRAALPNEIAGALIYSRTTASLRLVLHEAIDAGPGGVRYRLPPLRAGESLAVDLHTHGHGKAFWSRTDDADDQGIKVAGVFGNLHAQQREKPSAAFRLVINGFFKRLVEHPWSNSTSSDGLEDEPPCPTLDSLGFITSTGFMEETSSWNTSSIPLC
jgi:PRTRC genetic system protein A